MAASASASANPAVCHVCGEEFASRFALSPHVGACKRATEHMRRFNVQRPAIEPVETVPRRVATPGWLDREDADGGTRRLSTIPVTYASIQDGVDVGLCAPLHFLAVRDARKILDWGK